MQFSSSVNGYVTGVRFYKGGTANGGTHVGRLWSASGTLLASATFSNESTYGWQTVTFATPVPVTAGTTYVASYYAPQGELLGRHSGFFSSPFVNSPLTATGQCVPVRHRWGVPHQHVQQRELLGRRGVHRVRCVGYDAAECGVGVAGGGGDGGVDGVEGVGDVV